MSDERDRGERGDATRGASGLTVPASCPLGRSGPNHAFCADDSGGSVPAVQACPRACGVCEVCLPIHAVTLLLCCATRYLRKCLTVLGAGVLDLGWSSVRVE